MYIIIAMSLVFLLFLFSSLRLAKDADDEMDKYNSKINKP